LKVKEFEGAEVRRAGSAGRSKHSSHARRGRRGCKLRRRTARKTLELVRSEQMVAVAVVVVESVGTVGAPDLLGALVVGEQLEIVEVAERASRRAPSFSRCREGELAVDGRGNGGRRSWSRTDARLRKG
jgi:hypothetical protein